MFSCEDVSKLLQKINPRKAPGPDFLSGKILKVCYSELSLVFTPIFQLAMDTHKLPSIWKTSTIIPVPKKTKPVCENDYRPVALTPVIMKCYEKLVLKYLLKYVENQLDPFQFAYRKSRGTDDAIITLLHKLYEHLDKPTGYVRATFIDFSSAFNTIQPHLMIQKLKLLGVNSNIILWVYDFLTNRSQHVKVNEALSSSMAINTGAPQGCVISPVLFILYTNDCVTSTPGCSIFKYADDTVILGEITDNEVNYRNCISDVSGWCEDNFLHLNVGKTKEIVFDFRQNSSITASVAINGDPVDIVEEYKYLGLIIDQKLNWCSNTKMLHAKGKQRLYFLQKLRLFKVNSEILKLFYNTFVQSVILYGFLAWYSVCAKQNQNSLERICKHAMRICGGQIDTIENTYAERQQKKMTKIMKDASHPLWEYFEYLPSGVRLRMTSNRTERFKQSFVPNCIMHFNKRSKR